MRFTKSLLLIGAALLLGCTSIPSAQAAVNLLDFIPDELEPQLADPACPLVSDQYMADAIAATDGIIHLPRGCMKFDAPIHLKKRVHFIGEGGGLQGDIVTDMKFAMNTDGIVVHRFDTNENGVESPPRATSGMASILEGFNIRGGGTTGHGIWLRARATIRDVSVDGFGGNCINIVATLASSHSSWTPFTHGNANLWRADSVFLKNCKNGLYIEGQDVNAGLSTMVDARLNDEYGLVDLSFLGSTHLAPHTAANGIGGYKTGNPAAEYLFLGAYQEGGQTSAFTKRGMVIGGMRGGAATNGGVNVQYFLDGAKDQARIMTNKLDTSFGVANFFTSLGRKITAQWGSIASSFSAYFVTGDAEGGYSSATWDNQRLTWQRRHGLTTVLEEVTTDITATSSLPRAILDEAGNRVPPGQIVYPQGFWVPSATVPGRFVKVYPATP